MFWIILISLFAVVFGKFFWDRGKLGRKVVREGGMRKKFELLINSILDREDRAKIIKETSTYLCISASGFGIVTMIEILMAFRSVLITYKVISELYGEHKLEWKFPENENQEYILSKINKDVGSYLEKNQIINKGDRY